MRITLQLKRHPHIFMAGQLTGVEGYLESAAIGLIAGNQRDRDHTGGAHHSPARNNCARRLEPLHHRSESEKFPAHEHQLRPLSAPGKARSQKIQEKTRHQSRYRGSGAMAKQIRLTNSLSEARGLF